MWAVEVRAVDGRGPSLVRLAHALGAPADAGSSDRTTQRSNHSAIEPPSDRATQRSSHPAGERSTGAPGLGRARFGIGFYRRLAQAVAHSLTRRAPQPRDVSAARPTGRPADGTPTGWVGQAARRGVDRRPSRVRCRRLARPGVQPTVRPRGGSDMRRRGAGAPRGRWAVLHDGSSRVEATAVAGPVRERRIPFPTMSMPVRHEIEPIRGASNDQVLPTRREAA